MKTKYILGAETDGINLRPEWGLEAEAEKKSSLEEADGKTSLVHKRTLLKLTWVVWTTWSERVTNKQMQACYEEQGLLGKDHTEHV